MPGLLLLGAARLSAAEPFFKDGTTAWKICIAAQAGLTEQHAAAELQRALRMISGAEFEIVASDNAPAERAIVIGTLEHPAIKARAAALKLAAGEVEQIAVCSLDGRLYLAGNRPRGALYAVYSFLQRELGVRWLWPGPDGEYMPTMKAWSLPALNHAFQPPIAYRGFHLCGDWRDHLLFREWMSRNFINIHRHGGAIRDVEREERQGFHSMWSSHNARLPSARFEEHPEYFAEVKGRRYAENICFTHPGALQAVANELKAWLGKRPQIEILSIFPADNMTDCRCSECGKLDVSTAWFGFYNRLTDILKAEFPDLKFAALAYFNYRDVPQVPVRNSLFVEYATYGRCNVHALDHPECPRNAETMKAFGEWQATGLPIGNYGYEFDIFVGRNARFTPFLSMLDDAIKTGRRLGHVAMITEVILSPLVGPDLTVRTVQDRLPIYLYARLLWDPDQPVADILEDWCRTAFGQAAAPMLNYYRAMDRAWSAMPIHRGILGDALGVVDHLLTDTLLAEVAAAFGAADRALGGIAAPEDRQRVAAVVEREKALFRQWQDLYWMKQDALPLVNLPLLAAEEDFARSASPPQALSSRVEGQATYPTSVQAAWTREALHVRWSCHDPRIRDLRSRATERSPEVTQDDSLELVLSSGIGGERWHFAVNPKGVRQSYRYASVGVRDDLWAPHWTAEARIRDDRWEGNMVIPFASLGPAPNPDESWQAGWLRHNGGRSDYAPAAWPPEGMGLLFFSSAARTDRTLLWWSGAPERESRNDDSLRQEFNRIGWRLELATTPEALAAAHGKADVYWFRHPHGPNKVPEDFWREHLAPAVRDGALAIFVSYWQIPLETYFDDPALKVRIVSTGGVPLAGRRSQSIAPGDWSSQPANLLTRLKNRITPAYGFIPEQPEGWTVLATAPRETGEPYPYLMVRPYGKGLIILGGDAIPLPAANMLQNFVRYHESRTDTN